MKKIYLKILIKTYGSYINILSLTRPSKSLYIAYKLFSTPRKGKLKTENLPKTLQTANTTEIFEHQENSIHTYHWNGNDEIIFLIHGWESNSSRWDKLLKQLKTTGKTIIAIDAPAHGLSSGIEFNAPKYAEFIEIVANKYNPNYLIGHSIGGAAITYFLKNNPNSATKKVVLLGSPSDFKIISDNYHQLLNLNNRVKNMMENYFHQKFGFHVDDFKGHLFAENFNQKALIIHDTDDKIVLVEEGEKYASTWKNSTFIKTKGLGHSLHDKDLYKQIIEFIES